MTVPKPPAGVFDNAVVALSVPATLLTRITLGLVMLWLGIIKIVPGWSTAAVDGQRLAGLLTEGKVDGQVALILVGFLFVLIGISLLVPRLAALAVVLQLIGLCLLILLASMHLGELTTGGPMPNGTGVALAKTGVLWLAGIALAANTHRERLHR